jgi:hypothetical protein
VFNSRNKELREFQTRKEVTKLVKGAESRYSNKHRDSGASIFKVS